MNFQAVATVFSSDKAQGHNLSLVDLCFRKMDKLEGQRDLEMAGSVGKRNALYREETESEGESKLVVIGRRRLIIVSQCVLIT
jgi:hypothetical protein